MKNEIEIVTLDIDWLKIINMAFERKDWGKTYTLHKYGDVSITVKMASFDFRNNSANFRIECVYPHDEYWTEWDSYTLVDYHLENFTPEFFNLYMLKRIKRLIETVIDTRTKTAARIKFQEFKMTASDIDDDLIEEYGYTTDSKEINEISNEQIRNAAQDALNEEILEQANKEFNQKVDRYISENKKCPINMINLLDEIEKLISKYMG